MARKNGVAEGRGAVFVPDAIEEGGEAVGVAVAGGEVEEDADAVDPGSDLGSAML